MFESGDEYKQKRDQYIKVLSNNYNRLCISKCYHGRIEEVAECINEIFKSIYMQDVMIVAQNIGKLVTICEIDELGEMLEKDDLLVEELLRPLDVPPRVRKDQSWNTWVARRRKIPKYVKAFTNNHKSFSFAEYNNAKIAEVLWECINNRKTFVKYINARIAEVAECISEIFKCKYKCDIMDVAQKIGNLVAAYEIDELHQMLLKERMIIRTLLGRLYYTFP